MSEQVQLNRQTHTLTHTHRITAQLSSLMESVCDVTQISTRVSSLMAAVSLTDPLYDHQALNDAVEKNDINHITSTEREYFSVLNNNF